MLVSAYVFVSLGETPAVQFLGVTVNTHLKSGEPGVLFSGVAVPFGVPRGVHGDSAALPVVASIPLHTAGVRVTGVTPCTPHGTAVEQFLGFWRGAH